MPRTWEIVAEWEPLAGGGAEENCCFAALGIKVYGQWLTEGRDALANRLRQAPLLSAYHLAEWLAWNWWRLRWEPRAAPDGWAYAHKTSSIGGGYIWPNITIFSDGERTVLLAKPAPERAETPFRYISDIAAVLPSMDFESGVDIFVAQVLERLGESDLLDTNLSRIWSDLTAERQTPQLAQRRKLEALLGQEPDESDADVIEGLLADAERLSLAAVEELAADFGHGHGNVLSAEQLGGIAKQHGANSSPAGRVKFITGQASANRGHTAAWKLGAEAAKMLRRQESMADAPVTNAQLAAMLAVDADIVSSGVTCGLGISFVMDYTDHASKVLLRSKWSSGRRFELARLLGDTLIVNEPGLFPSTRAYTYRQKAQRSFAAELLSPFESVMQMLDGDCSSEKQLDAAEYFQVSPLTIRTQLVNHQILEKEDLDSDPVSLAAS